MASRTRLLVAFLLVAAVLLLEASAFAAKRSGKSQEDYLNVLLSPGLAQWLAGPIARMATDEEVRSYLELSDDAAANAFIDAFWSRRVNPESPWPGEQVRDIFENRAREADRLFTEGTFLGRSTDRGVTYVIFGEPGKRTFVQQLGPRKLTIEVWSYAGERVLSLDGSRPKAEYFFARKGDRTVFSPPPKRLSSAQRPRRP